MARKAQAPMPSGKDLRSYFLPYQVEQILDEARLAMTEKSIRIGYTFGECFRAVRRRVKGTSDYLHTSVTLAAAEEFIEQARKFNQIFDIVASDIKMEEWGRELNERGYSITYPSGKRIFSFSSNPKSIRSFGGDVGVDEIAFHENPVEMLKAAGGRAAWGHNVRIWSSHNGVESEFARRIEEERVKGERSRWKVRTITILDAVGQGLVEKINAVSGQQLTRDQFLADMRALCGTEEAFQQECMCVPQRAGEAAVKWNLINAARQEYDVLRFDLLTPDEHRAIEVGTQIAEAVKGAQVALGYDVARTGHLAAIVVNRREDRRWRVVAVVKLDKTEFRHQRAVMETILSRVHTAVGAGDKTGIGMQVCEELTKRFGEARFTGINFSASKPELGTQLVQGFEDGTLILPAGTANDDLAYDVAGIKAARLPSGRLSFTETANPLERRSHCDMGWALAMANMVAREDAVPGMYTS